MPTSVSRVGTRHRDRLAVVLTALVVGLAASTGAAPPSWAGSSTGADRPGAPAMRSAVVDELGVVSFNAWQDLSPARAWRDAAAIAARHDVDIIGWQEVHRFGTVLARLQARGFTSQTFAPSCADVSLGSACRASEVAVSWRHQSFELVVAERFLMHEAVAGSRYPVPRRFVTRVVLRHRATGRLVTVLNTHANHKIEDLDHPGRPLGTTNMRRARSHFRRLAGLWDEQVGDVTVGTADLNVDHGPDQRVRYPGFPAARLADVAVSSWRALGWRRMPDTFTALGQHRKIDYVFVARRDLGRDAAFVRHRVLTGLRSDHRPVLAVVALLADSPAEDEGGTDTGG
jgi:endonuclease/exonuclease/phosphatase family metal-dependent hydrolase